MKNKERMCFGIIIGTRAYFNSELAKDVRKQLLKTLADEGYDYLSSTYKCNFLGADNKQ